MKRPHFRRPRLTPTDRPTHEHRFNGIGELNDLVKQQLEIAFCVDCGVMVVLHYKAEKTLETTHLKV